MDPITIFALILGVAGIAINAIATANGNEQQRQHDKEMSELELNNQKRLLDYETELQQTNNTIATQKGHAAAAGFSPALLYGQMSTPQLSNINGGSTGASASKLNPLQLFDRMPISDIAETNLTTRQQNMNYEKLQSEIGLNKQRALESAARTMEQTRDTGVKKRLEQTIIDQATANLHLTEQQGGYYAGMTSRMNLLLPGELEAQGLMNAQTAQRTKQIVQDTLQSRAQTSLLYADKRRVDALASLYEEQSGTATLDKGVLSQQISGMQESLRNSQLGRVMSEFGLNKLKMPTMFRNATFVKGTGGTYNPWYDSHKEQINGALSTLLSLGWSPDEASKAVIFYCSPNGQVSSGAFTALSRVASALILKKD